MVAINVYQPVPYALALACFAAVVGVSVLAPGRRATRINPVDALRHE
jgi:ABC-type antimicrobial peptide transport system permease subunit